MSNKKYVIDTNILINYRVFTPMDCHITFWDRLSKFIIGGNIILIQDVAKECKDKHLIRWVKKQKVTEVSGDVRELALEINNEYKLIVVIDGMAKSEADPVIIAYAEINNFDKLKINCERWTDKVLKDINFGTI